MALKEPEVHIRTDAAGIPYMIKAWYMLDDHGQRYFFAIGRSLADSVRTVKTFTTRLSSVAAGDYSFDGTARLGSWRDARFSR